MSAAPGMVSCTSLAPSEFTRAAAAMRPAKAAICPVSGGSASAAAANASTPASYCGSGCRHDVAVFASRIALVR